MEIKSKMVELSKMLKESDNSTWDLFRFLVLAIYVMALSIAYYEVFYLHDTQFTFMDFCGGMALLIAPTAALFHFKKDSLNGTN